MYEACKKGYHQEYDSRCIVTVICAAFFHPCIAKGIFKQRGDFRNAGKKIKQVAKPETEIAIEVKRQQHICGGKPHGNDEQRDRTEKIPLHPAKTGNGDKDQNISQQIRHKIQGKDGTDDLIDHHINRIWRFCRKRSKGRISDGGFYGNIKHGD